VEEIWKDIVGYEDHYQISNFGRVKSLKPGKYYGGMLKGFTSTIEYLHLKLTLDGISKDYLIHRLVASAFIPNPNNYPEVNHKDCNKLNNRVENLEWVTPKQNSQYAYDSGKKVPISGEKSGSNKVTNEQVLQIRKLLSEGNLTQRQIGKLFGLKDTAISAIKRRQTWKHI